MGRRSRPPSLVAGLRRPDLRSGACGAARPGHRGVSSCESCCVCGVRCSGLLAMLEGVGSENGIVAANSEPTPLVGGVGARRSGSGGWSRGAAARRLGCRAARAIMAARGPAAPRPPRRLRGRAHARCARRGAGWRRCWPAGPARCSPTAARPRTGACSGPTRRASTSPRLAAATAPRGSACTALAPSMPRTPPTTKASRSRRSAARCSTSPPRRGASELERALAQAERLRLYDHRAIQSVDRQGQRAPRNTTSWRERPAAQPKWTRNEWEAALPEAAARGRAARAADQRAFHAPDHGHCEPDYHWPAAPRHRRDRRLRDPRHPRRLPQTTAPRTPR